MAKLYFTEEEHARVVGLNQEIRAAQSQLASELNELDPAKVKEYNDRLAEMKNTLGELISSAAKFGQKTFSKPEEVAAEYKRILDIFKKYLEDREKIRETYDQKKVDGKLSREDEAAQNKEMTTAETGLATELSKATAPALDQTTTQLIGQLEQLKTDTIAQGGEGVDATVAQIDNLIASMQKLKVASKAATLAQWGTDCADAGKKLGEVSTGVTALGAALGDSADGFVEVTTTILNTTQSMVSGIGTIVSAVSAGMKVSTSTASAAMKGLEMASVVLAVISAVIQMATAIASLFNNDKAYEKLQKESEQLQKNLKFIQENQAGVAIEQQVHAVDLLTQAYVRYHTVLWNGKNLSTDKAAIAALRGNQDIVNQLVESYAALDYSVGKALGEEKFKSARGQLENMAQQQRELMIQRQGEESKKESDDAAIELYNQQIIQLGEKMAKVLSQMTEEIIGGSAVQISKKLGDAFVDAFQQGGNAAQAWKDKVDELVADIVQRMMIQKVLEPKIGKIFDKYQDIWFPKGEFVGVDGIVNSMTDFKGEMNAVGEQFDVIMKGLSAEAKDNLGVTSTVQGGSSNTSFETMTQETAGELNGRFTDLQAKATGILGLTSALGMQSMLLLEVQSSARNIAAETRDYAVQGFLQLTQIADNTAAVVVPIRNMAEQLENISLRIREL